MEREKSLKERALMMNGRVLICLLVELILFFSFSLFTCTGQAHLSLSATHLLALARLVFCCAPSARSLRARSGEFLGSEVEKAADQIKRNEKRRPLVKQSGESCFAAESASFRPGKPSVCVFVWR